MLVETGVEESPDPATALVPRSAKGFDFWFAIKEHT
jgi:hypothetical protein